MTTEEIILFAGALVLGIIKVPLVDWLKTALKVEGTTALVLAYIVAFVIAIVALLLGNGIAGGFTLENLFTAAATIIATAQAVYKVLNPEPQT